MNKEDFDKILSLKGPLHALREQVRLIAEEYSCEYKASATFISNWGPEHELTKWAWYFLVNKESGKRKEILELSFWRADRAPEGYRTIHEGQTSDIAGLVSLLNHREWNKPHQLPVDIYPKGENDPLRIPIFAAFGFDLKKEKETPIYDNKYRRSERGEQSYLEKSWYEIEGPLMNKWTKHAAYINGEWIL